MTDKQIKEVFKNGFYCIEPCPEIKELQAELKAKEQECERLKLIVAYSCHDVLYEDSLRGQLDQLKAENERLEAHSATLDAVIETCKAQYKALSKTLTEIKEIASKVLLNTHDLENFKDSDALFGTLLEIHKKISECEGNNE